MRRGATKFTKHQHYSSYVFHARWFVFLRHPRWTPPAPGKKVFLVAREGRPRRARGSDVDLGAGPVEPSTMAPDRPRATAPSPGADPLDEFRRALGAGATSFLSPSEERAAAARDAARALFSRLSTSVAAEGVDLPFPELHTEGLDVEQVWMQIEMQLEPLLGKRRRR